MAGPGDTTRQLGTIWRQIGLNQKISILLVGVGSVVAVLALVSWGGRPSYGLLYSNLSRKDAAAIVAQLEADAIPYKLEDNGTTVLVQADLVQKARAKMITQGIPAGGDGFEILDKRTLGMTDFGERKTYLRALQGELARTISCIEPIEWARVHISAPEPTVFLDRDKPTTASVLLKVRSGATLNATQVASIASFVARSVEGLDPSSVTITDQFLNPLSKQVSDDGPGSPTAHLEAQREVERHLTKKVQDMLDTYLGKNRSTVSIAADIKLKQEELHSTEYPAEGRVPRREKTSTTKSSGNDTAAAGAAGTASNLPSGARPAVATAAGPTKSEVTEELEYEVPKKETTSVDKGIDIKRLTVSVLVAGAATVEKDKDGKETKKFTPLPEAELTKLSDAVKQAVGADETTRKDMVKVECVEFNQPTPTITVDDVAGDRQREWMINLVKQGSAIFIVLAFLMVARSMLKKARAARQAAEAQAAEAQRATAEQTAAAARAGSPPLRERVSAAVQTNPAAAAELLKSWYKAPVAGSRT